MLIVISAVATLLAVVWLILLGMVTDEDWIAAAYNKVFGNLREIDKLKRKDAANRQELEKYHGIAAKVMGLFLGGNHKKEIEALLKENKALQRGNLKTVSIFPMPGYVLLRRFESIGRGTIHKTILEKSVELYGKKHAANQAKQLLAKMLSYPIIGIAAVLALGVILMAASDLTMGLAVMGIGAVIILVLIYAMYDELSDQINKRRDAISRQFPNVVSKLALLVTSGMIMDRAWRETAESQELELYQEMRKTADELDNLMDPAAAYTNFIDRCNTKETTKLASAIIQNQSKGNAEIGYLLKGMAHEAWQERRHTAKRDSEAANSKLMIPTMMLFIAILIIIMVPVAMNFMNLSM